MLTATLLAHQGGPLAPHDLWTAWNLDPTILTGLVLTVWLYRRGRLAARRHGADDRGTVCFGLGVAALALALVSPLDALSGSLASAHMVQHMLLIVVAAPLLALSRPLDTMMRGTPRAVRKSTGAWRRKVKLTPRRLRLLRQATLVWLLHAGGLWVWHGSVAYGAALRHEPLHVLEHVSLLGSGLLFWVAIAGSRRADDLSRGHGALMVFAMAMQSVFLAALITFAGTPWYREYASTTGAWGFDPLADQQLAGVIMWVPAGLVYTAAGVALVAAWIQEGEDELGRSRYDARGRAVW